MSVQHLSEIESSKRDPRLSSVERIADAMELAVMLVPEHMSPFTSVGFLPVMRCTRASASGWLLQKLSNTVTSCSALSNSTQVWGPI